MDYRGYGQENGLRQNSSLTNARSQGHGENIRDFSSGNFSSNQLGGFQSKDINSRFQQDDENCEYETDDVHRRDTQPFRSRQKMYLDGQTSDGSEYNTWGRVGGRNSQEEYGAEWRADEDKNTRHLSHRQVRP